MPMLDGSNKVLREWFQIFASMLSKQASLFLVRLFIHED